MTNNYFFKKSSLRVFVGFSLLGLSFFSFGADSTTTMPNNTSTITRTVNDSALTDQIKAKYVKNPILNVFNIKVETHNGIVNLSGQVDSDAQYERAIILAENTAGVKDVNSSGLQVKSSQHPMDDTIITAKIKGSLLKNKLVGDESEVNPWPIHVETKDGVVYLTGTVDKRDQIDKVVKLAKMVDGVKSVRADLTVHTNQ